MATPNFSELENKENSFEQLQKLLGVPAKFVYTAEEWNKIKEKINELYALINGSTGADPVFFINQNNPPVDFGGFYSTEPATTEVGLTFTQFAQKALFPATKPTISFNVNNTNIEIGSNFSQTIVITFTKNDAGNLISYSLEKNGTEVSTTQSTAFSETNIVTQFTLQAFVSHEAGQSLSAGTINTALRSITPRYKYWSYSGGLASSPTSSVNVRALTDNGLITGQTIQAIIPQGDTEFSIYIPATESLESVLYVESSNADITANFTETIITVNDAGGTSRSYKKLTQTIGGTGYTAEATYLITLA